MTSQNRWYRTSTVFVVSLLTLLASCSISTSESGQLAELSELEATNPVPTPVFQINDDGSTTISMQPTVRTLSAGDNQTVSLTGSVGGPATLDPALVRDAESSFMARHIFRGLIKLNSRLDPVPDLAERIDISADGLQYRFSLRSEVTFHDGAPITAQKVADSFNRATDPALVGGNGSSLPAVTYLNDIEGVRDRLSGDAPEIKGISVLSESVIQIQLEDRATNFLYKLSGSPALIVDSISAQSTDWWRDPNGSGPFEIGEYKEGDVLKLNSVDDYWAGSPYLDTVEFRFGANAANPLNQYESGQIDIVEVPNYALDRVLTETDPLNSHLRVVPQFSTTFIVLNGNIEPFSDPALRKAMFHALDREKIVEVSYSDNVMVANGLVPPGILNQTWDADLPDYSLEVASDWLTEVVSKDPAQVYGGGTILTVLKETLEAELGYKISIIGQQWNEFSAQLTEKELPGFILSWIADYPDPENFLTALFHSESSDNYTAYFNENVDQLLDAASSETDEQRRADLFREAQQLIVDDGVLIPVLHDVQHVLVNPKIRNLDVTPVGILTFDDVWIEN